MTSDTGADETRVLFRDVHEASLALLQAPDQTALWQALLGHAISIAEGHGGSFWISDDGMLRRIMVGGVDAFARAEAAVSADESERLGASDEESLALAYEIRIKAHAPLGVLRVCRARENGPPDEHTCEALTALIEMASAVASTLLRHADVQARAQNFALVAEMSREVTATLDLDRVLRAVVNLAARALTFDRGALALYEDGNCDIRAVSGADTIDSNDSRLKDLAARAAWAAGRGEGLYVSDRDDPASDAERVFLQFFAPDLEADDTRSGLYLPLRDEEGIVGVLVLEAARSEFASEHQREVAGILANQATVAIRNARLYSQVPLVDVLGAIGERRRAFRAMPRRRKQQLAALVVTGLALLTLVRWPLRVDGNDAMLLPAERTVVRALVNGQVEQVLVSTGQQVQAGDPLLQLRTLDRQGTRDALRADIDAALREASFAASRGDAVGERVARLRAATARQRAGAIDAEIGATVVRAPVSGIVLTERPYELTNSHADAGAPLLVIGRTDSLELEFTVPQRDVARVLAGQSVRLRVEALPQRTFEGRVRTIAPLPSSTQAELANTMRADVDVGALATTAEATFSVRALVANHDGALKPGMHPYARVLTASVSVAGRLLRRPLRAWRLFYWRMTA